MCKKLTCIGLHCKNKEYAFGYCKRHLSKDMVLECCICYTEVDADNCLKCNHSICISCLNNMRDDICPICRKELKGRNVNCKLLEKIRERKKIDKYERESEFNYGDYIIYNTIGLFFLIE